MENLENAVERTQGAAGTGVPGPWVEDSAESAGSPRCCRFRRFPPPSLRGPGASDELTWKRVWKGTGHRTADAVLRRRLTWEEPQHRLGQPCPTAAVTKTYHLGDARGSVRPRVCSWPSQTLCAGDTPWPHPCASCASDSKMQLDPDLSETDLTCVEENGRALGLGFLGWETKGTIVN